MKTTAGTCGIRRPWSAPSLPAIFQQPLVGIATCVVWPRVRQGQWRGSRPGSQGAGRAEWNSRVPRPPSLPSTDPGCVRNLGAYRNRSCRRKRTDSGSPQVLCRFILKGYWQRKKFPLWNQMVPFPLWSLLSPYFRESWLSSKRKPDRFHHLPKTGDNHDSNLRSGINSIRSMKGATAGSFPRFCFTFSPTDASR